MIEFDEFRVFRETPSVEFLDISISGQNATDLVVHKTAAVSPPDDEDYKTFYIHAYQVDHNRILSGSRCFELINPEWQHPYHEIHLSGELMYHSLVIPKGTYHRSVSGKEGSILINQAVRDDDFDEANEFRPVSVRDSLYLQDVLNNITPIIHRTPVTV